MNDQYALEDTWIVNPHAAPISKAKLNKPKTVQPKIKLEHQTRDSFQTPNYATKLLIPYLFKGWRIWELCAGGGKIVECLRSNKFKVHGSDITYGVRYNALQFDPEVDGIAWDCAVTNPPYSIKAEIVKRFWLMECPCAFLVPGDWAQWMIALLQMDGAALIVPERRISYITPTGRQGKESAAQFHSVWLTRYLNTNERLIFAPLSLKDMEDV